MKDTGERLIPKLHQRSIAYGEHLARYKAASQIVAGKVVLDIACGTGYGTLMLAEKAKKVYGIDLSQESVDYAGVNYPHRRITYSQGDALAIPLEDHTVDVVVSLETIEHLPDPKKFVEEVKRVLVPGGVLVVSTPNDDEFTEGNVFHIHEFDFKELDGLMKKYFKNFEYYYQGSWYSSGVLSAPHFTGMFDNSDAVVGKSFDQKLPKAIYYIAVASDASLTRLTENIMIADVYSGKADQENHLARVAHVDRLDKIIADQQQTIGKLQQTRDELQHELDGIRSSKGWKMLQHGYKLKTKLKP